MSEYGKGYKRFIEACENLVVRRLEEPCQPSAKHLLESAKQVREGLVDPESLEEVEKAFANLDEVVGKALYYELQYVTEMLNAEGGDYRRCVDDARTAKDSLEDLFDSWLSDKVKNLLKVLNEILSLVR